MLGRYGSSQGNGRFRAPLDVTDAIAALGSAGSHLRSAVIEIERDPDADPNAPVKLGPPQMVASTSTEVAMSRTFSWDVNGWYRALGIPWPYVDATRAELRAAGAQAEKDNHLHHGLRVLLGRVPAFGREHYDAMALGTHYVDPIEQDEIDVRRKGEATSASNQLASEGITKSPEEVMADMGFRTLSQDEYDQMQRESSTTLSEVSGTYFPWGFWLQGNREIDYTLLAEWQSLIAQSLNYLASMADYELEGFVVGLTDQVRMWRVMEIEREVVFLLGTQTPTSHAAMSAALFALGNADLRVAVPRFHRRGETA